MAPKPKGKGTQIIDKEAQKFGRKIEKTVERLSGKYKPEEVGSFRTFFTDLLRSPRAARQAQIEREGAQRISNAYDAAIRKRATQNIKEYQNLTSEQRGFAEPLLKGRKYNNSLREVGEQAVEKERKKIQEQMAKELENLPGWGGYFKNSAQNILNSKIVKYGVPIGAASYGIINGLSGNSPKEEEFKYRWTPNVGWEKNEDGKWSPQQREFGVDRYGNVNYYDGQNWVSDYLQGSDGTVYNRQGQVIGSTVDPIAMRASGYDNIFDYNAAKALGEQVTPEQIVAMQQLLGVTPDGKWGARTQAAYERGKNSSGLFTIYQ